MAAKKTKQNNPKPAGELLFGKENYKWMLIGLAITVLGFILMAGGANNNPEVFNEAVFSWRRIRLAPFLVIAGFMVQVYAILRNPEKSGS